MGDILLLVFSAISSGILGLIIFFLVRKRVSRPILISLAIAGALPGLLYWFLTVAVPTHNAKVRILQYTKDYYLIEYNQIEIVERSPEEGEILAFSDNETGAIAFKLSQPIELKSDTKCEDLRYNFYWLSSLKKSVPANRDEMHNWKCARHVIHQHDHYILLHNTSDDMYFFAFSWSFG